MALEDLEGVGKPDVTGGRPKKTNDDDDGKRDVEGRPYTKEHGEEYWVEMWQMFYSGEDSVDETIANMADYTMCLPRTVVKEVHDHGVADLEDVKDRWDEWINESEPQDTSEFTSSDEVESNRGSGLSALIN